MIKQGILNPDISSLLCRFRHTNTLVIADRGFPFWSAVETVDISLVDDVPTVRQVLEAVASVCVIGRVFMAEEFLRVNNSELPDAYRKLLVAPIEFEPHAEFKKRVPHAIGLIRTGDTTQYGNIILESA
jgi:D-ribose pyranase